MKHIFFICQDASESLGLEKVLNFYNVVALENSDSAEDIINSGTNMMVALDLGSNEFKKFVTDFSYDEKPFILSSVESATIKLSQLYDWDIQGIDKTNEVLSTTDSFFIKFTILNIQGKKVFGNAHKYIVKDYGKYLIEILEWNIDPSYLPQIQKIADVQSIKYESTTIITRDIGGQLKIVGDYDDTLPEGMHVYTHAQVLNDEMPFVLDILYKDISNEVDITFTEGFEDKKEILSQTHTYDVSLINIRSKYETVIKNDMPSGVWKFGGDNTGKIEKECIVTYPIDEDGDKTLCLLHRGYSLYDITDKEGMVICTRDKGISINSGDSIGSIKTISNVTDSDHNILGWAMETINAILQYQL